MTPSTERAMREAIYQRLVIVREAIEDRMELLALASESDLRRMDTLSLALIESVTPCAH